MEGVADKERQARNQRRKMMVYDPETGCYRKAQSDEETPTVETKTERVEYRFRLRSDEKPRKTTEDKDERPRRTSEDKDSSSKPDKTSEDVTVSMEPVQYSTEQTIVLNGKERSSGSQGREDEDGDEKDIKKAGDIIKARFEEGRKKFEQEPVERKRSDSSKQRTRATSDDSLDEKIREMEKRRERLLLRGPSGGVETKGRRASEERKDTSPKADAEAESPRDGTRSPDDGTKKQRSRSERNKRRLTAEEMSLRKSLSEEDLTSRTTGADAAKVPKTDPERETETKSGSFSIQLKKVEKPDDEVFVTQVKPVEASANPMSWGDSTDGPLPENDPAHREFRKRADSMEGEMFPRPMNLVEIEAPITVVQKEKVESTPVFTQNLLDLDESSSMSAPAIEPISTRDKRTRVSNSAEEDRRRREREHEERKRRIEENQRRAAKDLKAKKQGENDVRPRVDEPVREMSMKEKRRSLVDMWESLAEPQTNVMSFEEDEQMPEEQSHTTIVREKRTVLFDPLEDKDSSDSEAYVDMEVGGTSTRPSVENDKNTNLTEDEQRWESAGQFQPGRLQKTMFHSLSETAPAEEQPKPKPRKVGSRYDWMKGETSDDQAALVPTKLKLDWQSGQAADEKLSNGHQESSPEPIQMEIKTQSRDIESSSSSSSSSESARENESESESEEERIPRVDSDEFHHLTEEEKQWERAGHFQPKKLNIALMTGFQQAPVEEKPFPKKTQTTAPTKFKIQEPKREEPQIEEISPVSEVKTETEPDTLALYTHVYEEESDDDDDVPGWRKMEEKRRQQEKEEIERARLEEQRRMEREAAEEGLREESDSSDDEFDSKVRTGEVRRINPNLLGQFMKEPEKEPEKPLKTVKAPTREQNIDRSNVLVSESTPVVDSPFEDDHEIEKEREVEDEYEEKVKSKQIRKLKLDDMPFMKAQQQDTTPVPHRDVPRASRFPVQEEVQYVQHSTVESAPSREWEEEPDEPEVATYDYESEDDGVPEWRKMEERRKQQEKEEIERARLEEQRRMEREAQEAEEQEGTDSDDDEFEAKVKTKEIRRINPNLLGQFMAQSKEEVPSTTRPKKETIEIQQVLVTETVPQDDSDYEDVKVRVDDDNVDDEFELKVKNRQVNKLVLDNSPFMQKQAKEEVPVAKKRSNVKKDSRPPVVQEDVLVHDEVVESQPEFSLQEAREDDEYEGKIKSRDVKKLNQNQFVFLRKQEEEERKRLQEEERRRTEREEKEILKKEEERRRRLEAEARAKEEERIRREEEMRIREEQERVHREEEKKRRLEEAERVRREEEERLRKEEEEEMMRLEEMRRQKQAAKLKFQTGSFDEGTVTRSEKDIYSVGRLDATKFMQFQQTQQEEPKPKPRSRVEKKKTEEYKIQEEEVETVQVASVDLIESSPYEEEFERVPTEDELYEDKRKSVGKLDRDWFLKQQQVQEEENARRTRELEEQRLREERNEMLRIKSEVSKRWEDDDSSADTRERISSEIRRSKLAADKFSPFAHEGGAELEKPKKVKESSIKIQKKEEVQSAPGGDDFLILGMEDSETTQRKIRLQREREETELLRQEEERRRILEDEESPDEIESDKPMNVGKLNIQQFTMFQQGGNVAPTAQPRKKQAPKKVEEVVTVQSQQEVESAPVILDETDVYRGATMTQEEEEYESRINTGKRLDVSKFLSSRSQDADERAERARRVADERRRREEEELAILRLEERKRMQAQLDTDFVDDESDRTQATESRKKAASSNDSESSRKKSIEKRSSKPKEPEPVTEEADKGFSVGRLPEQLRSQFEGDARKTGSDSHRKSSNTKGSRSSSTNSIDSPRSTSTDSVSSVPRDRDMNGDVGIKGKSLDRKYSIDRREASKEIQDQDTPIEHYTDEEKPVPKKLHAGMFAAFQKGDSEPVPLRRAKSEKRIRPNSIGNVDLLKWQDDSSIRQSSSDTSKKGKSGRQPRPKSIAY